MTMEYNNTTANSRKNKHLNDFERGQIQLLHNKGYSAYRIAKELRRASNTIRNELKRGTVTQIKGIHDVQVYYPDTGKLVYEKNRKNCKKKFKALECSKYLDFVKQKFNEEKWSLDAICGYAKLNKLYEGQRVCTKTLYNYVDIGLIGIKSIDLPLRVKRKPAKKTSKRKQKKTWKKYRRKTARNRNKKNIWKLGNRYSNTKEKQRRSIINNHNRKKKSNGTNLKIKQKKSIHSK